MSEEIFHLHALTDDSPGTLDESTSEAPIGNREEGWLKIGQILTSKLSERSDVDAEYILGLIGEYEITPEELKLVVIRSGVENGYMLSQKDRLDSESSILELIAFSRHEVEAPEFEPIRSKNRSGRPESISQSFIERSKKLSHQRRRWDRGIERSKKARRFFQSLEEQ